MSIADNLEDIKKRIIAACERAGRDPSEVRLVAVSKTKPNEDIIEAYEAGQRVFGENYMQEAVQKVKDIDKGIEWHFIGHLQSNKVKKAVENFRLIHAVDSIKIAKEMNKRSENITEFLIEVNVSGEDSKFGLNPNDVNGFLEAISELKNIKAVGFMTMAPFIAPEKTRPYFKRLRELRDTLQADYPELKELSMGMTSDFEIAIEEGSTLVRVGTAIFGSRNYN